MMKTAWIAWMMLALSVACGGDEEGSQPTFDAGPQVDAGPRIIDFLGTWSATSHVFTNNADTAETYGRIANGGETRMVVLAGGNTRTFVTQEGDESAYDGTLEVVGDVLRLTTNESPPRFWNWSFELNGSTLTLEDTEQEFDFTLSGAAPVSATENIVLELQ